MSIKRTHYYVIKSRIYILPYINMPRADRSLTLTFLTSHMPEDATRDERLAELPRAWEMDKIEKKKGTCQGCNCDKLATRFWLRSKTGRLPPAYLGSSCIQIFEHTSPAFVAEMKPLLDEASYIEKIANRKIPKALTDFAAQMPFKNYRQMKAIDKRTRALWDNAVRYCLKKLTDEERAAYSRI